MSPSLAMIRSLRRQACGSGDGEAFAPDSKGPGWRIGVGSRTGPRPDAGLFVEVVLDPFPDRPRVSGERLQDQGRHVAWLGGRGYRIACDADGTVTCERVLDPDQLDAEVRALRRRFGGSKLK